MKERILVIGSGTAALSAVKSIRETDHESPIIMFGDEPFYPYKRLRLTKALLSPLDEDTLLLEKKEWYPENDVDLLLTSRIKSIVPETREVILASGDKIPFTKLLIATGARNFTPPLPGIDHQGVYTLRTLQDAWDILKCAKNVNHVLMIGGGVLGLETAWGLTQLEKKVTVVELLPRIMPKQLDEEASNILKSAIESYGIDVYLDTQINEILGSPIEGVSTKTGEHLSCDMIIYSTGIQPNIDVVQGTSIKTNRGILVNERMETNIPGIYAAGDVAEFNRQILGLWPIAVAQGKVAGYNIAGQESFYQPLVPNTAMNTFKLPLFSMGNINEWDASDVIVENHPEQNSYRKVLIQGDQIIGAMMIGDTRSSSALRNAIENQTDVSGFNIGKSSIGDLAAFLRK